MPIKPAAKPASLGAIIAIIVAVALAMRGRSHQTPEAPSASTHDLTPTADRARVPEKSSAPTTIQAPRSEPSGKPAPSAGPGVSDRTAPEPARSLRVGAWNIEWLGKPAERSGLGQGTAQTTADLVDYIAAAKLSLLAVEEIVSSPGGGAEPRSRELDEVVARLSNAGQVWRYELYPGRSADAQLTGVLWNTSILTPVGADGKREPGDPVPMRLAVKSGRSSQGSGLWNRPPHAMKFSAGAGKTDIVVIVVHMKADYQGDFAAQRDEEARALVAVLPEVRKTYSDDDVVVLGDTNMTRIDEPARKTFTEAGLLDLNRKGQPTHWRGGATDRIFAPAQQPEFSDSRFEVLSDPYLESKRWDPRDFKRRLSDHYMVITTISVQDDDD